MPVVSPCREILGLVPQRAQPFPLVAIIYLGTLVRLPSTNRRKLGTTSSPHGPYGSGFTRHTMVGTEGGKAARWSQAQKADRSPDRSLQLDSVKSESLVIVDQHATVNTFQGLVHTARHTMGVGFTRSR